MINFKTFDEIFAIMELSFPPSEIRTYEDQRELLALPQYRLLAEQDADGRTVAFLAAWEFAAFRFVEHIAVDPQIRGGGLGRKLMTLYRPVA